MQDAAFMHTVIDKEQLVKDSIEVITNFTSCIYYILFYRVYRSQKKLIRGV